LANKKLKNNLINLNKNTPFLSLLFKELIHSFYSLLIFKKQSKLETDEQKIKINIIFEK